MLEREFQTLFKNTPQGRPKGNAAYEFKVCGKNFYYAQLKEHQEQALLNVKYKSLYFKIPDAGFQNPFDAFVLEKADAYVVIRYDSGNWYCIDIDIFNYEKNRHRQKILTEKRAAIISSHSYFPKRKSPEDRTISSRTSSKGSEDPRG